MTYQAWLIKHDLSSMRQDMERFTHRHRRSTGFHSDTHWNSHPLNDLIDDQKSCCKPTIAGSRILGCHSHGPSMADGKSLSPPSQGTILTRSTNSSDVPLASSWLGSNLCGNDSNDRFQNGGRNNYINYQKRPLRFPARSASSMRSSALTK